MKKIICTFLVILAILICIVGYFLYDILGYITINISNIDDTEKEEIISIIGLDDLYDEINLEKIIVPKVYKDIYYKIYFNMPNDSAMNDINLNTNFYNDLDKLSDNKYSCTVSKYGKSIDILEKIIDKYEK